MIRRHLFRRLLALAVSTSASFGSLAETNTITLIVPFAPGGPTDQLARAIGQKMTQLHGVNVVVDNRPGGGGQIGASMLKAAPADGRTLFIGDLGVLAVNRTLYKRLSFDTQKDFQPLTLAARSAMLLLVPGDSKAQTPADLVTAAKASANGLSYASQGVGIGGHLLGEMFKKQSGADFEHVPYRGAAPAVQDLLAGRVAFLFEVPAATLQHVKEGRLKALAVASDKRFAPLPQVPTMTEAGFGNATMDIWWAIVARAGTPAPQVNELHRMLTAAIEAPDVRAQMALQGLAMEASTPEALTRLFGREIERLGNVVRESGATVE